MADSTSERRSQGTARRHSIARALRHRNYRLFFGGQGVSLIWTIQVRFGQNLYARCSLGRLVDTEGFFLEHVAGGGVSACPASHADIAKLATAAFSFQIGGIAQKPESAGVLPDVGKSLCFQVAGRYREIAAGIDVAFERDEADAGAGRFPAPCPGLPGANDPSRPRIG